MADSLVVKFTHTFFSQKDKATTYHVRIACDGGEYETEVRYSTIRNLHDQLKKKYPKHSIPSCPPKKTMVSLLGKNDEEGFIEQRREQLEKYLYVVLRDHDDIRCSELVRNYLLLDNCIVARGARPSSSTSSSSLIGAADGGGSFKAAVSGTFSLGDNADSVAAPTEVDGSGARGSRRGGGGGSRASWRDTRPRAVVLFDWSGDSEHGHLSLYQDETVMIIEEHDSGWWTGESRNKVGYFPASYVEKISSSPPVTPTVSISPRSSGETPISATPARAIPVASEVSPQPQRQQTQLQDPNQLAPHSSSHTPPTSASAGPARSPIRSSTSPSTRPFRSPVQSRTAAVGASLGRAPSPNPAALTPATLDEDYDRYANGSPGKTKRPPSRIMSPYDTSIQEQSSQPQLPPRRPPPRDIRVRGGRGTRGGPRGGGASRGTSMSDGLIHAKSTSDAGPHVVAGRGGRGRGGRGGRGRGRDGASGEFGGVGSPPPPIPNQRPISAYEEMEPHPIQKMHSSPAGMMSRPPSLSEGHVAQGNKSRGFTASLGSRIGLTRTDEVVAAVEEEEKRVTEDLPELPAPQTPENLEDDTRTKIVTEIVTTERTYVRSLACAIAEFLKPLRRLAPNSTENVNKIFLNLELILNVNIAILSELEVRYGEFDNQTTKLGEVFMRFGPFMKMYRDYMNGYEAAIEMHRRTMQQTAIYKSVVEMCERQTTCGLDLCSLLIQPVQRIPRYQMLLQELHKKTADDHPDKPSLATAIELIKEVAQHVNQSIRRAEQGQSFFRLNFRDDTEASRLVAPHRHLLKDGHIQIDSGRSVWLKWMDSATLEKPYFLLFDDVFVFAQKATIDESLRIECLFELRLLWLPETPGNAHKNAFIVVGPDVTLNLKANNAEDKTAWLKAIQDGVSLTLGDRTIGDDVREGRHEYPDGVYEGAWNMGKRHGRGKFVFLSGNVYEGDWESGFRNGYGIMTYATGDVFEGGWSRNKQTGPGVMSFVGGGILKGEWQDGILHGIGIEVQYADGSSFVGDWFDGVAVSGRHTSSDGHTTYTGSFDRSGLRDGKGSLVESSGASYDGRWRANMRHGSGKYTGADGSVYIGDWNLDRREGQGRFVSGNNNEEYTGAFVDDKFHGHGVFSRSRVGSAFHYDGEWANGLRCGKGRQRWSNKDEYDGQWLNDRLHGSGVLTLENGTRIEGKFVNGRLEGKASYAPPEGQGRSASGPVKDNYLTASHDPSEYLLAMPMPRFGSLH
eukprot:TRINITY_DN5129_c0_g1_i1.p1 TRINITY_DN5129_c0_g1~~TRINITY_DN5129_c0_g1_i1.p1  ORF type:complete len:1242 (+),score=228.75 TRINITY_DN5129_c0_g1_i1:255-3980(+)